MTTNKNGNNQKKRKDPRGRPPLKHKSVSVHCRVPFDLYQLLEKEARKGKKMKAGKPNVSGVLMDLAKNSLL